MFDRTTNDCRLFSGSLSDLYSDCKEVGYAKQPEHSLCDVVFESNSVNGCYVSIQNIKWHIEVTVVRIDLKKIIFEAKRLYILKNPYCILC